MIMQQIGQAIVPHVSVTCESTGIQEVAMISLPALGVRTPAASLVMSCNSLSLQTGAQPTEVCPSD